MVSDRENVYTQQSYSERPLRKQVHMEIISMILVVVGLILFETISSIDNAVINAEVLSTMSQRARRWFLIYGLFFAVFVVRGMLPWLIVWANTPEI